MIKSIALNNLGTVNKNDVRIENGNGDVVIFTFSYKTIVGVYYNGNTFCHVNDWSTTTGKLLNELEPDKKKRLGHDDFMVKLGEALNFINA